jgi:hypothetical protein
VNVLETVRLGLEQIRSRAGQLAERAATNRIDDDYAAAVGSEIERAAAAALQLLAPTSSLPAGSDQNEGGEFR